MPYTFEIVITLKRGEHEEISIVRKTHHLYHGSVMALVESWTRPHRREGWRVHRIYEQNFNFILDNNLYEHG